MVIKTFLTSSEIQQMIDSREYLRDKVILFTSTGWAIHLFNEALSLGDKALSQNGG